MLLKYFSVFFCLWIFTHQIQAQEKSTVQFGHVTPDDFDVSKLAVDTTAGAVIIADIGSTTFKGNNKGWFTLVFKKQRRIKIINKNAFDLANVDITLYQRDQDEEKLETVKGITYNLEDGNVVESKLKDDALFKTQLDKNHISKKFTLPAVKEGSIIEYSYTITSDFLFNLQPWDFQGSYPRVWSEYQVDIPDFFQYVFLLQGYRAFDIHDAPNTHLSSYIVRIPNQIAGEADNVVTLNGNATINRWVLKNVPALKKERFTTSISNYISKIEFQLSRIQFPDQPYEDIMGNWLIASKKLLADEDFGAGLAKKNGWLDNEIKNITANNSGELDKARKIYYYVQNNIKSTGVRGIYLTKTVKDVFKNKSGTVAEVNMLLTTMLQHENLQADPVILSTRDNGFANEVYPLIDRYNYQICSLNINGNAYFLDATESYLGFGRLPDYCYNGQARIINEIPAFVYFLADSLQETKSTTVVLLNDTNVPGKWIGDFKSSLGYYESSDIRDQIASKGKADWEKNLSSSYTGEYSISDIQLNDLDDHEKPIELDYKLMLDGDTTSNIIYFNPMIKEGYTENYFKSTDRKYPVEMPYKIDETYTLNMEVPEGYEIDELPQSVRVSLSDTDGSFEYLVSKGDGTVSIQSHLKLNKVNFQPEEYQGLRDFFDYVVKKHSEQVVFKKKK